jgi:hypothetical protein
MPEKEKTVGQTIILLSLLSSKEGRGRGHTGRTTAHEKSGAIRNVESIFSAAGIDRMDARRN